MSAAHSTRARRALGAFVLGSGLALAASARADRPSILIHGTASALTRQVRAELAALGFQVTVSAAAEPAPSPADLQDRARDAGVMAAVSLIVTAEGVEVWLLDRVTGKVLARELLRANAGNAENDRIVAVRVVELLRASLLELELPQQTRGEEESTPALRKAVGLPVTRARVDSTSEPPRAAEPEAGMSLDAGLGLSSSWGAVGATPIVALGASWWPSTRLGAGISGAAPLVSTTIARVEGSANVATWRLTAGSRFYPLARRGRLQPVVGVGLGVVWFQVEGTRAEAPYTLTSDQLVVAGPQLDLGLHWHLSSSFAFRSSIGAHYAFPKPVVSFAEREVMTLGRPLVFCSVGLEFSSRSEPER